MKYWNNFKNILTICLEPWPVVILVFLAILYLWLSHHYLFSINVYYWISVSIISSYIFYLVVIKIKEVKDKQNINPVVIMWINRFVNKYNEAKNKINEGKDEISKDPQSKTAPLYYSNQQRANWFEYLSYIQKELDVRLKQLMQLLHFLESKLVKEIVNLQDDPYFRYIVTKEFPIEFWLKLFNDLEIKTTKLKKFL